MSYFPTVVTSQEPEHGRLRPGMPRREQLILPQHHRTLGLSIYEQNVQGAYLGANPRGAVWYNSADREGQTYKLHGESRTGQNISEAMVWVPELGRFALDCDLLDSDVLHAPSNDVHPLHFCTEMSLSCLCYIRNSTTTGARIFALRRSTLPGCLVETDYQFPSRIRFFACANTGVYLDTYTNTNYPVNEWFVLTIAYVASTGMAVGFNGTQITLTVRGGAGVPANMTGTGSNLDVFTDDAFPGMISDLIIRKKNVSVVTGETHWIEQGAEGFDQNTSLSGFVREVGRGISEPPSASAATPLHRAALQGQLFDDFVLDDENPISEGVQNYWPIASASHLPDYGPAGVPMNYVSTGYLMNQVSWYKNAWGARAYGTGHHYRAKDLGDIWPVGECTVSCWVNNSATITSSIFGNFTYVIAERFNCHCAWSDGKVYWDWGGFTDGTSRVTATLPANYFRNTWRHVLLYAKEAVGMGVWVDGKLIASHTSASTPARSAAATQGDSTLMTGAGYRYEGSIAEFVVWDRLLSDVEKVEMFQNPLVLRKYRQSGRPTGKTWLPPTPVAPVSNAYTNCPRVVNIEDSHPTQGVFEPYILNSEEPAVGLPLKCFFAPNGGSGSRLLDNARITPAMQYLPANWSTSKMIIDPDYGHVWDFVAASNDRATAESFTQNEIAFRASGGWSIEIFFKPDTTTGTQYLVSHGQISTAHTPVLNFALRTETATLRFIYRNSANTAWIYSTTSTNVLTAGEWCHAIFWHKGASWGWIVNGEAVAKTDTGSLATTPSSSAIPMKFGARYDQGTGTHSNGIDGKIALVRIYWGALPLNKAEEIYAGLLVGKDPFRRRIIDGPVPINLPIRHWAGEDSDWFTANNWSRSPGGVRGAGVPSCGNPVRFEGERPIYE